MSREEPRELKLAVAEHVERGADGERRISDLDRYPFGLSADDMAERFRAPWLDSRTAAAYVGCKSIVGWYAWRKRHAIVGRGRLVARADLDRALRVKRLPRRMAPASLANLRKRP